ncbi:MAG: YbaN family protein [Acinetobacter sp.]
MNNLQSDQPHHSNVPPLHQSQTKCAHSPEINLARHAWIRGLCILVAWLCIFLGILGVFIPGLPTLDFFMLAAFFAARGSKKLHTWLYHNRFIGPILQQWQHDRSVPRKIKYFSSISMTFAAILMICTIPHPWVVYPLIFCMMGALFWLWKRPEPQHHTINKT